MFIKFLTYVCMIALMIVNTEAAIIPTNHIYKNILRNNAYKINNVVKGKFCKIIQPLFAAAGKPVSAGCSNIVPNILSITNKLI